LTKILNVALILVFIAGLLFPGLPIFAGSREELAAYATDHILVKFKTGIDVMSAQAAHSKQGTAIVKQIGSSGIQIVKVPSGSVSQQLASYRRDSSVEYAEPDYVVKAIGTPDDRLFSDQWGLTKIQAQEAWDVTTGNPNIKIAILDSGIDQDHEDLAAKITTNQNFTSSTTVDDLYGHGTFVAGIAAAITNNGGGIAGVGYNSSLMNIKVIDDTGMGYISWTANGIIWAADNGAKVINLSLGGFGNSQTLEDAVNYAWNRGVVVVAASGNNGNTTHLYPAYYPNCISVAATDSDDKKTSFSNYGEGVDVAAPGMDIYSTSTNHASMTGGLNYGIAQGTSFAAPFVAGLAGLIWSTDFGTSNISVRNQIELTADQIQGTGDKWQFGRINAYKATSSSFPMVNTGSVIDITETSSILQGNLTRMGIATSVQVCFEYGTTQSFSRTSPLITLNERGDFCISIDDLSPSSSYYFRAKAIGNGISYGIQKSFSTPPYVINAIGDRLSTISPSGAVLVNLGGSQSFTIAAKSNYHLCNVIADDVSQWNINNYTFTNVNSGHTINAYSASGEVWAWGNNSNGQLGDSTVLNHSIPEEVVSLSDVKAISGGVQNSMAVLVDGTVWDWGRRKFGYMEDDLTLEYHAPAQVHGLYNITNIALTDIHNLAQKSDGTVWAWGNNSTGQLGDGTNITRYTPVQVTGLSGVTNIDAGDHFGLALREDGTVWAWGNNVVGQLGVGTTAGSLIPVKVRNLNKITAIATKTYHALALKNDGTVWAWGDNQKGQLGDGTTNNQSLPIRVNGLSEIVAVSAGDYFSLALKGDGTVWAWGNNQYGQLGNGTTINSLVPIPVSGLSGVISISAGFNHAIALKSDGKVWAWGLNSFGNLGNNSAINSSIPVLVINLNGVTSISAGSAHNMALKERITSNPTTPTVTGISPAFGPTTGGTSVTITGSGFYGGGSSSLVSAVTFGTIAASDFVVTSNTSITATAPADSAGTVDVTVTTRDGTSVESSADKFTYVAALVISTTSLPDAVVGCTYPPQAPEVINGTPPYKWAKSGTWPAGLTISKDGVISGKPNVKITAPKEYNLAVTVTDSTTAAGILSENPLEIHAPAPDRQHRDILDLNVGDPDIITEEPEAESTGNGLDDLKADDVSTRGSTNLTATKSFTITIYPALNIALSGSTRALTALPGADNNSIYNCTLAALGGKGPYVWSKGADFPAWLNLDNTTGILSGTPAIEGNIAKVNIIVTDNLGYSLTKSPSLKVNKALTITTASLPSDDVGVKYKATTLKASGGKSPYTFSIVGGSLPGGLSMTDKGAISGTPADNTSGTYAITFQVSDGIASVTKALSIVINPALAIAVLPDGIIGTPYYQVLSALTTGGSGGYKYSIIGTLPTGLRFNAATGVISGTPTGSGGIYNFSIKVTDSLKGTATLPVFIVIKT
jgi:thermitase